MNMGRVYRALGRDFVSFLLIDVKQIIVKRFVYNEPTITNLLIKIKTISYDI